MLTPSYEFERNPAAFSYERHKGGVVEDVARRGPFVFMEFL
jgi:hypothetical protein